MCPAQAVDLPEARGHRHQIDTDRDTAAHSTENAIRWSQARQNRKAHATRAQAIRVVCSAFMIHP